MFTFKLNPTWRRGLMLALMVVLLSGLISVQASYADEPREEEPQPVEAPMRGDKSVAELVIEGEPLTEQLEQAFSEIGRGQLPSGILLDAGSVLYGELVKQYNGIATDELPPITNSAFINAYGDLARAGNEEMPEVQTLSDIVLAYRQEQFITPLTLAVINYEHVQPEAYEDERLTLEDGVYQVGESENEEPFWDSSQFVTVAPAFVPTVYGDSPTFILPSELIISNEALNIESLTIQVAGMPFEQEIQLDEPFTLNNLQSNEDGLIEYTVHFQANDKVYETKGAFAYRGPSSDAPSADPPPPTGDNPEEGRSPEGRSPDDPSPDGPPRGGPEGDPPPPPPPHLDLPPVEADIPFTGNDGSKKGKINLRVYPEPGSITNGVAQLQKVMVVVDGFDVLNNRTQEDIWADFGSTLTQFQAMGFDLVVIDYTVGNDYIERNGLAIRKFLVDVLPTLMAPSYQNNKAVVLGGSMGTQTARYALRTAEQASENHNVDFFIALDGPFAGANIPISLQALVQFLAPESPEAQVLLNGLNSPAASQLLLKNRSSSPWPWLWLSSWYEPRSEFTAYYNQANALGLPTTTRNIAIANGSGTGTLQNDGSMEPLSHVDWNGPLWTGIKVDAKTDHNGQVFYGKITKLFSSRSMSLSLDSAEELDIAQGGYRNTPQQIATAYNSSSAPGNMTYELGQHNFIPTTSALAANFDEVFYEKCNTEHVTPTTGNMQFMMGELNAYLNGTTPPTPTHYQTPCGQPEAQTCVQDVAWWDGTWKDASFDGANCYVSTAPDGATGPTVINNEYYIDAQFSSCPTNTTYDPSVGVAGGCFVISFSPNMWVHNGNLYLFSPHGNCPQGTTQTTIFPEGEPVCFVMPMPSGHNFFRQNNNLYLTPAMGCQEGILKPNGKCYLGTAPLGTNAFYYPPTNAFYYDE